VTTSSDQLHVSKASQSAFASDGLRPFLEYRDLDLAAATGGRWRALMSRSREAMYGETGLHNHVLEHQLIYVLNGEATFEYGQHGKFTVIPGDCVYQPAGIIHQQTQRTRDCVILELVSPAEFPTTVVDTVAPYLDTDSAKFCVTRAADTPYTQHPLNPMMMRRDLGIAAATGGRLSAQLSRLDQPMRGTSGVLSRDFTFHFVLILQGMCEVTLGDQGSQRLIPGDAVYLPQHFEHEITALSDDYECLEVIAPSPG
jgi:quercetin dioxygenase-like cupin family protein